MECRLGCGACCIVPSISSKTSKMLNGKKSFERCPHLDQNNLCELFGKEERPSVCSSLKAQEEMCGFKNEDAFEYLTKLEELTKPDR